MAEGAAQGLLSRIGAGLSWRGLSFCFAPVLALLTLAGVFAPLDRLLGDLNFSLWSRPAGNDLVLVESDARSLQKRDSWPWSRADHAALILRLSAAGAETIAFDIDFSARSAPAADDALAQAIAQSGSGIVLAAFAQPNAAESYTLNLPLPMFRDHAQVGLVNIVADDDGEPRRYRLIEDRLSGNPVTMAALLAAPATTADNAFLIDYGIDPASIPRLSYVDVLTGRFDPTAVAGKKILIGATALELGDRFAVPKHGVLAGVEIQALAYASIAGHRAIHPVGSIWALAGLAVIAVAGIWSSRRRPRWPYLTALAGVVVVLALGFALQNGFAIALGTAPWLAAIAGGSLLTLVRNARRHARAALLHRAVALRHKALMQGVFNDSSDGILIAAGDGRVEIANAAAARLLEATPGALLGRPVESILTGLALRSNAEAAEIAVTAPSGRQLDLAVSITRSHPADTDRPPVWIITFRDESAKRGLEAAREATIRELQAATAAKNQFLARMSHELRTPLSAIIGFSTIIGDQSMGPVGNAKYIEYAQDIHSGGKRLLELVNDIIDIARIEAEQYEIRSDVLEVRSLFGGVCIAAREAEICGEKSLRFDVAPGAEAIHSDRLALAKVIGKLISNAIKFTGPKGDIVLKAFPGAERAIVFEVTDDGIGIAPGALKNVLSAFSQVHGGLDRRHEGSGLGLYLANRLSLLLGGTLEIESTPGAGTTVRLIFPGALIETSQAA